MTTYTPPTQDQMFILYDVLGIDKHANVPGFEELTPELTSAVLDEAGKLASEVLAPLNVVGDTEGCTLENGVVRLPAYRVA